MVFLVQILLNSFVDAVQVMLVACSLYLIYSVGRVYHIALAGIAALGSYAFYSLMHELGWSAMTTLMGFLGAVALMTPLHFLLLKPFLKQEYGYLGLLVSICLWTLLESLLTLGFGPEGEFLTEGVLRTFSFGPFNITAIGLWTLMLGLFVALVGLFLLYGTPAGRLIRAVKQHPANASLLGIQESKVQFGVFFIATLLACVIGLLLGVNQSISPDFMSNTAILGFLAFLVGGMHDFRGLMLASFLFMTLPEVLIYFSPASLYLSSSWEMFFIFVLALILLVFRPNGLLNPLTRQA